MPKLRKTKGLTNMDENTNNTSVIEVDPRAMVGVTHHEAEPGKFFGAYTTITILHEYHGHDNLIEVIASQLGIDGHHGLGDKVVNEGRLTPRD